MKERQKLKPMEYTEQQEDFCLGQRSASISGKAKRRHWFAAVVGALLGLLLLDCIAYPYLARPSGPTVDHGENGLWLRYTWYFGLHPVSEIPPLAQRLHDEHI